MILANLHLVTGYAGREHVTAADQGAFNVALLGSGQWVMDKGNKLAASIVTNNQIRVLDGDIYMQGRFIRLNEGSYADLVIENGTQSHLRNDLIVARYTKDAETGIEEASLVVIKGTAVASDPEDPSCISGNIIEGKAYLNDLPLYRVVINGLTIEALVPLFSAVCKLIPYTAADMGAVNKAGDTMTGSLVSTMDGVGKSVFCGHEQAAVIEACRDKYETRRQLWLSNTETQENDALALGLACMKSGANYHILHTGNKPSGSYTGNGDATTRTIETGGLGNVVAMTCTGVLAIVGYHGAMYVQNGTVAGLAASVVNFRDGILTINSASAFNANGATYIYQVL